MKTSILKTSLVASAFLAVAPASFAAVILSFSPTAPTPGALDQYQFNQSGAQSNSQDFTDNAGAPGQSFTTPNQAVFLNSISFKIAHSSSVYGPNSFDGSSTWGLQIARFDNVASGGFGERTDSNGNSYSAQYLSNPITKVTHLVTSPNGAPTEDVWLTFSFTGTDILTLAADSTYAFSVYSPTGGYIRIYRSDSDSYAGGTGFRPYGNPFQFNDNYVMESGWDRTFHVGVSAIPEPTSAALLGLAALGLVALRRLRRA
jgi:hypothetical protein